ncbi:glycosyltransferase [Segatella bryantii]|uniref:Glycosyltransferase n=1 Tax=Segatella bryantii TaxID=77095 RepID=A0ABX4EKD0_SEGBR|nr:glycosyltransferase [Segatella bryantii]OYP57136.1 hypothetical protein CIK91_00860 [Segatella bryantii]UKK82246.1 glycosyltransferase [Segatella bryantii]
MSNRIKEDHDEIATKNLILVDMPVNKSWGVLQGLEDVTNEDWIVVYKEGRLSVPRWKRILNFIIFPLSIIFVNAKNVIAWQQFYGFLYLTYCKLFNVRKNTKVIILTFIYKQRIGLRGYIYKRFVQSVLNNQRLKRIVIYSKNEVEFYSDCFPQAKTKFVYLPLGIEKFSKSIKDRPIDESDYIFTAGVSNRDYDFLISLIKNTNYKLKIACDGLSDPHHENVEVLHGVHGKEMYNYLYHSKVVVIPLKDLEISSGQLMLLQAMQFGKPVIVSNNKTIYDYVTDGYDGFILPNNKDIWLKKIALLYSDSDLYQCISQREIDTFKTKFTDKVFGQNIAKLLK